MSPEDPRHGQNAGYIAGCRLDCCREASLRYSKRLKYERSQGRRRTTESWRAVRRLDALAYLGWSRGMIADHIGVKHKCQLYAIGSHDRISLALFARIDAAYEQLSMRLPIATTTAQHVAIVKTRNNARRRRSLPPMAWLDIDNENERPDMTAIDNLPDPVVIDRILAGDFTLRATRDERWEVIRRWAGSDGELERMTSWNVARDRREMAASEDREREAS